MRNKMILLVLAVCLLFCACEFSLPQIEYGFSREISPEGEKFVKLFNRVIYIKSRD